MLFVADLLKLGNSRQCCLGDYGDTVCGNYKDHASAVELCDFTAISIPKCPVTFQRQEARSSEYDILVLYMVQSDS